MIYQFGDFRLDAAERLLTRDGQPVALTPKAFDLLVYLVEHQGRLVEKSSLMAALWPDAIVEEANLAFQVSALRKALDEREGEALIQTVPTKGYRFVAAVTRHTSDAAVMRGADSPSQIPAIVSGPSRQPAFLLGLGLLVILSVVGGTYLLTRSHSSPSPGTTRSPGLPVRLVPVTALTGWQDRPSLSPDGEQVAFEWAGDKGDANPVPSRRSGVNSDIYVTIVGSRDVRRLTTHPAPDFAPSWSPNGREIAFLRTENDVTRIHVMSALGGPDRTVSDFPAWPPICWSPDARFIVSGRMTKDDQSRGIYLVPVSGGAPRAIDEMRSPSAASAPAFSPDGHRLAYVRCEGIDPVETASACQLMTVDIDESYAPRNAPRRLTLHAMGIRALGWSRDGRTIVFSGDPARWHGDQAGDSDEFAGHLWRISPDDLHAPERIEVAGLGASHPTTSTARDRLVFSRGDIDADVYRIVRGGKPQRLLTSAAFDAHAQFSSDGRRIAFYSERSGTGEIWIAEADGSSERQLTHGPTLSQGSPRWSPDGSLIAFDAQEPNGGHHIWVIPSEGGAARQLTKEEGDQVVPTWSHDQQWIYYSDNVAGGRNVWRVRSAGGTPERISSGGSGKFAFESADGRHVIYKLRDSDAPLVETSLTGNGSRTLLPCITTDWGFNVMGESVYYLPCAPAPEGSVRVLSLTTGRDRLWGSVPDAGGAFLWDLAMSPDGTSLLYTRFPNVSAHLWMLENFR